MLTYVDLTSQIGPFTPCILVYFSDLQELDIGGCRSIDPSLFVDCIVVCTKLRKLVLTSCTQFSQYQIVKVVRNKCHLEYLEASNTSDINYANAYLILSHVPQAQFVNFDPHKIFNEIDDWTNLFRIFHYVHFVVNIMRFFPFYGKYLTHDLHESEV